MSTACYCALLFVVSSEGEQWDVGLIISSSNSSPVVSVVILVLYRRLRLTASSGYKTRICHHFQKRFFFFTAFTPRPPGRCFHAFQPCRAFWKCRRLCVNAATVTHFFILFSKTVVFVLTGPELHFHQLWTMWFNHSAALPPVIPINWQLVKDLQQFPDFGWLPEVREWGAVSERTVARAHL